MRVPSDAATCQRNAGYMMIKRPFIPKVVEDLICYQIFLVMHKSGPFFQLTPAKYEKALQKYPELCGEQDIDYIEHSASASTHVSSDAYFDNLTILTQFERLFKLLEFKE
jgi:hypothetical protein